jgi:hypothetical protein
MGLQESVFLGRYFIQCSNDYSVTIQHQPQMSESKPLLSMRNKTWDTSAVCTTVVIGFCAVAQGF